MGARWKGQRECHALDGANDLQRYRRAVVQFDRQKDVALCASYDPKGCLQSRAQSSAYLDTGRREGGDAQLLLQVAARVFRLRHMSARRTIIACAGVSAPPAAACSSARRPNGSCVHSKARVGSPSRASNFCVEAGAGSTGNPAAHTPLKQIHTSFWFIFSHSV